MKQSHRLSIGVAQQACFVCRISLLGCFALLLSTGCSKPDSGTTIVRNNSNSTPTFSEHVAPIVWKHCSECHRPDGAGPFSLLTYEDVSKRADQIVEVIDSRYMPPWKPMDDAGTFEGERILSGKEKALVRDWVSGGTPQGNPDRLPAIPTWNSDWTLGTPDMIVKMPESFEVPADGDDVYRNFVIPISIDAPRHVKAIEIRPSNIRVAHHLYVRVDREGKARDLAAQDELPGFAGMEQPRGVQPPEGCILSWQVGKQASQEPPGISWRLEPGMDFVVECHMQPTGKVESLNLQIGLHFTDQPPTRSAFLLTLRQLELSIPANEAEFRTKLEYTLPIRAEATAVLPHAHYLGKQLTGYAILPDGKRQSLIQIDDWDFAWQGEYRYRQPISLPAGTKIVMDYLYDNSEDNVRNPNSPPQLVSYGPETTDEMAELAVQLVTTSKSDAERLRQHCTLWRLRNENIPHALRVLAKALDPHEQFRIQLRLGKYLLAVNQLDDAQVYLDQATRSSHVTAEAWYFAGRIDFQRKEMQGAYTKFRNALTLDPKHLDSLNGIGIMSLQAKKFEIAAKMFQLAVRESPHDAVALTNCGIALAQLGKSKEAKMCFERVVAMAPDNERAKRLLQQLERDQRNQP